MCDVEPNSSGAQLPPRAIHIPHLVSVRERIQIAGIPISKKSFSRHLTGLKGVVEELIASKTLLSPPTYFEILSCLAFLFFAEEGAEIAVLEVGMGGRFDATNIVKPLVTAITTISPEHQKFLGTTQSEIASEKAGIIKPGVPLICGVEEEEAHRTIRNKAGELNAPFFAVFADGRSLRKEKAEGNFRFEYKLGEEEYVYMPSLLGEHQGKNAAIAISVSKQLSQKWKRLEHAQIIRGIETAHWPGRLEIISKNPLVLVDGAHNVEGAKALRKYIQDFIASPIVLIFAVMRDKNIEELSEILFPLAQKVICTKFPFFKAAEPEDILRQVPRFHDRMVIHPNVQKAVQSALQAASSHGVVLVAGSLFLIGEIKKIFAKKY